MHLKIYRSCTDRNASEPTGERDGSKKREPGNSTVALRVPFQGHACPVVGLIRRPRMNVQGGPERAFMTEHSWVSLTHLLRTFPQQALCHLRVAFLLPTHLNQFILAQYLHGKGRYGMGWLKRILFGNSLPMIGVRLLAETLLAIIRKLEWTVLFERLLTRLIVYALRKIQTLSTNDVVDETVEDILVMLRDKRLKEAK